MVRHSFLAYGIFQSSIEHAFSRLDECVHLSAQRSITLVQRFNEMVLQRKIAIFIT